MIFKLTPKQRFALAVAATLPPLSALPAQAQLQAPTPDVASGRVASVTQIPPTVTQFARQPTPQEFIDAYPAAALEQERGATVRMTCFVTAARKLSNCDVSSETPRGLGFGDAALKLAPLYEIAATAVGTSTIVVGGQIATGEPTPVLNQTVRLDVDFSYLAAIQNGGVNLTNALVGGSPASQAEADALLGASLTDLLRRGATSAEIRATLREGLMTRPNPSLERFLFARTSATDTLTIETTSAPGVMILSARSETGAPGAQLPVVADATLADANTQRAAILGGLGIAPRPAAAAPAAP